MDPSRKRKIRLVVALSVAVLLAVALIYTSFSASTQAREPSQVLTAAPGTKTEMNGKVVRGSVKQVGEGIKFEVKTARAAPRSRSATHGSIPDPFRGGREIVLKGAVKRHLRRRTGNADHEVPLEVHYERERIRQRR